MATDYSILEQELTETKTKLERKLHMQNVRSLCGKQEYLAKAVIQRKRIETLTKQVAELQSTVSTLYCPQYALQDHEIKGYLVYLLKMKDFFTREVATKEESIEQLDMQIKTELRKICAITREQAKLAKNKPKHSPEFVRLENMSDRMEQMNKRISTMRQENQEIMENLINMRKFQKQFKKFEREFRYKINYFKKKGTELLEKAVSSYEEKDEFMAKKRVFEERRSQDLRKTAITENALNLCIQRTEKNEAFAELQATNRTDDRLAEAKDMMEEGITGIEPSKERLDTLQNAISAAAGEDAPDKMEENFRIASENIDMTFSYLDELLKDINRLQIEINILKKENMQLTKSMSRSDKHLRTRIKQHQDKAQVKLDEANKASESADEAKSKFNSILDIVKSLYEVCCPEGELEQGPIDETNVIDYLQEIENQLLTYLICIEYNKMKEASKEDKPVILEAEVDEGIDIEVEKTEQEEIILPKALLSETDLDSLAELESEKSFLQFRELRKQDTDG